MQSSHPQFPPTVTDATAEHQAGRDLEVGELQGAEFKIEPLRRTGESPETMRARLLCMIYDCFLSPFSLVEHSKHAGTG